MFAVNYHSVDWVPEMHYLNGMTVSLWKDGGTHMLNQADVVQSDQFVSHLRYLPPVENTGFCVSV